jgi:hypothetical protein
MPSKSPPGSASKSHDRIVGLIPEAAAFEGMVERLSLDRSPGILEQRMGEAGLSPTEN